MTGAAAPGSPAGGHGRGLHRFAVTAAVLTFLLVGTGSLVTSLEAGMAVPDWPLSFGSLNPDRWTRRLFVREEHGHRLTGALVGLVTVALAVALHRREPRPFVRRLGWIAVAVVVLQGVLGGLRVLEVEPAFGVVHACLAQGFLGTMVALAVVTRPSWRDAVVAERPGASRAERAARTAAAVVLVQIAYGALVRHYRVGHEARWVWPHAAFGAVAVVACLAAAAEARVVHGPLPGAGRAAAWVEGGVVAQVLLGALAFAANIEGQPLAARPATQVAAASIHHLVGAGVFAGCVALWLETRRRLVEPGAAPWPAGAS